MCGFLAEKVLFLLVEGRGKRELRVLVIEVRVFKVVLRSVGFFVEMYGVDVEVEVGGELVGVRVYFYGYYIGYKRKELLCVGFAV